jgi:hypothetical protein
VGWREAGWLDRIGARDECGRQGRRARVLACRGCRDRGGKRAQREEPKSQKQARNILGTCLQHPCNYWGDPGALRCWQGEACGLGPEELAGLAGGYGGGGRMRPAKMTG